MTKLFCLTLKVIKSVFNCSKVCFTNMAHSDFYTDYRICDLTDYLTNIKMQLKVLSDCQFYCYLILMNNNYYLILMNTGNRKIRITWASYLMCKETNPRKSKNSINLVETSRKNCL